MKKLNLSFLHDPKFRYGSLSTALLCVALAVLVALNGLFTALERKYGWRVDYSFNSITSHSEITEEVLSALETPVHIYALYEKGNEDLLLFELLNRYAAASDLITWEQAPLSLHPTFPTRFAGSTSENAITADSLVVYCEATNRFRVLDATDFLSLSIDYDAGTYSYDNLTTRAASPPPSPMSPRSASPWCIWCRATTSWTRTPPPCWRTSSWAITTTCAMRRCPA